MGKTGSDRRGLNRQVRQIKQIGRLTMPIPYLAGKVIASFA